MKETSQPSEIVVWGGGILDNTKKPEDLKRFNKNKKQKQIIIGSIIAIVLIIGAISLYRSFAMYEEKQTFDVLKGTVPDFSNNGDIILAYTIDGVSQSGNFPARDSGLYGKVEKCENNATAEWDNESWGLTNIVPGENKKVVCTIAFKQSFSSYLVKLAQENVNVTESGLLIQSHEQTAQTGENATTDYRYIGPEPNNFVCLEEDGNCNDEDKLYRIVGIIPTQKDANGSYELRVKLVKYKAYEGQSAATSTFTLSGKGYAMNSTSNFNSWVNNTLNRNILNNEYWQSIESYQNYIENAKWYLGGLTNGPGPFTKFYNEERGNTGGVAASGTIYTINNVALMYPSDYGYSTSGGTTYNRKACLNADTYTTTTTDIFWGYLSETNTNPINHGECAENSWIYNEDIQWLLSPYTVNTAGATIISITGAVWGRGYTTWIHSAHPSFYLKASVLYKDGDGSIDNPYQIDILE